MASGIDELRQQYRKMLEIRRFEEEAARAYAMGKIGGFLHLYIGQEAIAVGTASALIKGDYVFQTYRDHGIAIALGMTANAGMAELFGKDTGCSRGLGGSMHFFDPDNGFYGGWGIVGPRVIRPRPPDAPSGQHVREGVGLLADACASLCAAPGIVAPTSVGSEPDPRLVLHRRSG